jgi:hypothetical protein
MSKRFSFFAIQCALARGAGRKPVVDVIGDFVVSLHKYRPYRRMTTHLQSARPRAERSVRESQRHPMVAPLLHPSTGHVALATRI